MIKHITQLILLFSIALFAQQKPYSAQIDSLLNAAPGLIAQQNYIHNSSFTGIPLWRYGFAETDTISILHIGDSHIAGKYYPRATAEFLFNSFKDGGSDFFAPAIVKKKKVIRKKKRKKTATKKSRTELLIPFEKDIAGLQLVAASSISLVESPTIKFYSYGVSGKTYKYFTTSQELIKYLKSLKPSLVIISLGGNDSFTANYSSESIIGDLEALLAVIKTHSPSSRFVITTPTDAFLKKTATNPNLLLTRNAIIEYCEQNSLGYWDIFGIMGGENSMNRWFENGLAQKDKIHFSKLGYKLLGYLLADALYNAHMSTIDK